MAHHLATPEPGKKGGKGNGQGGVGAPSWEGAPVCVVKVEGQYVRVVEGGPSRRGMYE
ncbi:hypothetical protein GCM10010280_65140 [Streptomyces pilosus]|uniref:Uncharacterized protein n=1 Tax=Streptomyces pilosus TaxID=28893 RepID=A0A918C6K6_9ACTN|nr:hypothetical protein GCM10010280_65140 [Streptomyces pilosus]